MARRYLCCVLGCSLGLLVLGALATAASADLQKAKATTEELTEKNVSTMIKLSSTLPDEFRIEIVEIVQGLELSRDRIVLFLDRIERGTFPSVEGVKRAMAIAQTEAQKEKEFLQALMERAPEPVVPEVEKALTVSAESWEGILIALQDSNREEKRRVPARPGTRIDLIPAPFPLPSPSGQ
ncbi:MAG: hypothetical protein ACE5MG_02330 [Candidatus Methylomirabilales bacterium]